MWRPQMSISDCGAACLATVLDHHGQSVALETLREDSGTGRGGVTATGILRAARMHGLEGAGVRLEPEDLARLGPGAILHWEFRHFVVFERVSRGAVTFIDPALGRRRLPLAVVSKSFTGVALVFNPPVGRPRTPRHTAASERRLAQEILAQRALWVQVLLLTSFMIAIGLFIPFLSRAVLDRGLAASDEELILTVGVTLALLGSVYFWSSFLRSSLMALLRAKLDQRLLSDFVAHMFRLPPAFFDHRTVGDLVVRVQSNITVRETLSGAFMSVAIDGAMTLVFFFVLAIQSVTVTILVVTLAGIHMATVLIVRRGYLYRSAEALDARGKQTNFLTQSIATINTLKVRGVEDEFAQTWSHLLTREMTADVSRSVRSGFVDAVADTMRLCLTLAVLTVGADRVLQGALTLGQLISLAALSVALLQPVASLTSTFLRLQQLRIFLERIEDVTGRSPQHRGNQRHNVVGQIRLHEIYFRYEPLEEDVVRGVCLDISPGETVAIVGSTGSGKSTLAAMIPRLLSPRTGSIELDGVRLEDLDVDSLTRGIGFVPQNPGFFQSSVRFNILLREGFDEERMRWAAEQACISQDIESWPLAYDTMMTDAATTLSGGQRQRISIARALFRNPALIILDEATNQLDKATEGQVLRNIQALGRTTLMITHRLPATVRLSRIIVMKGGRIVGEGGSEELMATCPEFRRLQTE